MRYGAIRNKFCLRFESRGLQVYLVEDGQAGLFIPAEYRNNFSIYFAVLTFWFFCVKTKEQYSLFFIQIPLQSPLAEDTFIKWGVRYVLKISLTHDFSRGTKETNNN